MARACSAVLGSQYSFRRFRPSAEADQEAGGAGRADGRLRPSSAGASLSETSTADASLSAPSIAVTAAPT